jgi:hypothetical protein
MFLTYRRGSDKERKKRSCNYEFSFVLLKELAIRFFRLVGSDGTMGWLVCQGAPTYIQGLPGFSPSGALRELRVTSPLGGGSFISHLSFSI